MIFFFKAQKLQAILLREKKKLGRKGGTESPLSKVANAYHN